MADLRAFMSPDDHASADGTYLVRSLYLESHDWTAFRSKAAGESRREKLRVRAYMTGDTTASPVKFEIKYRRNDRISKDVAAVDLSRYRALLPALHAWRTPGPPDACAEEALRAFFALKLLHALAPRFNVQFRRLALLARGDPTVRVTFDDRVRMQPARDLFEPMDAPRVVLGPGTSILEIKIASRLPGWLRFLISKYGLRNDSVSKFCHAALATPLGLDALL